MDEIILLGIVSFYGHMLCTGNQYGKAAWQNRERYADHSTTCLMRLYKAFTKLEPSLSSIPAYECHLPDTMLELFKYMYVRMIRLKLKGDQIIPA